MSPNLDALLAPVSPADPCGANLEYGDTAFAELDRSTQGRAEQQIGATIIPAEEPDWKQVGRLAADLLARTKDLRVAAHLTKALLHTDGLRGFSDGLTVLLKLVDSYWDGVHPRLDPEDGSDPTMRVNILSTLTAPDVLAAVRATPLVVSRTIGRFSLKDVEAAAPESSSAGNGAGPSAGHATIATVEAAGMDSDLASLQADASSALACTTALTGLEAVLAERIGADTGPGFGPLLTLVQKIGNFLQTILARRVPPPVALSAEAAGTGASPPVGSLPGEIGSREDVLRALERILGYYKKNEPSSPIPLFIERCKRLVTMSFIDIVRDLVPDAASQIEVLRGRTE
jgi:type VI secretion system protein ImpA